MRYESPGIFELLSAWKQQKRKPDETIPMKDGIYRFARRPLVLGHVKNQEIRIFREWFVLYCTDSTYIPEMVDVISTVYGQPLQVPEGFIPIKLGSGMAFGEPFL